MLLMDEPFAALDAMTKPRSGRTAARERETGCSIMFITHDIEAVYLGDRIAVIANGAGRIERTFDVRCRSRAIKFSRGNSPNF